MDKLAGPFAIAFDSKDMPGRMRILYVSFHQEIVAFDAELEKRQFRLLPPDSPYVAELRKVLG